MNRVISSLEKTWLGPNAERQTSLKLILLSLLAYTINALVMLWGVQLALFDARAAAWMVPALVVGPLVFYGLVRSGWSERWSDPSLVLPQSLYCVAITVAAYAGATHPGRSMILVILPLVCMFGQFSIKSRDFAIIGVVAVGLLAAVTAWRFWHMAPDTTQGEWLQLVYVSGIMFTTTMIARIAVGLRNKLDAKRDELADAMARLQALATTDELTGLPNRRRMQDALLEEARRQRRQGSTFCVVLIDLDHFKRINDLHGHQAGDSVLKQFAHVARQVVRELDLIGRWGGEEFLLLLPGSDTQQAMAALDRLKMRLAACEVLPGVPNLRVSYSAGLALHDRSHTVEHTLELADRALYEAKAAGRNRVHLAMPIPKTPDPLATP